uniref:Uncharacterized protein n=1 Tax=Solanum tuberosum TaxID=4113 RepID=M1D3B0_SOLTU
MKFNLPLPFVVDHQHIALVCHVSPVSQLAKRYNPVEQWIQEVVSMEAPCLVVELVTL